VVGHLVAAIALIAALQGGEADLPPGGTFTDDNGSVHESSIEALVAAGITSGCNPPFTTRYCPDDVVTRGQMAAFLRRAGDIPFTTADHFTDDAGSRFEEDINAISEAGITRGCNPPENDAYCPDRAISRAEFATMLVRTFGYEPSPDDPFVDDEESIHEEAINAIAAVGVTLGCNPPDNDHFCPDEPVSRAQMASFLVRALGLDPIVPPPPPPEPGSESCIVGADAPTGALDIVSGETDVVGPGTVWDVRFEVEVDLGVDGACFASEALRILNDPRSWGADGDHTFRQVDGSAYDVRLILASPAKTDALCYPVPTGGIYSCRNGNLVVLNFWRWENGADPFAGDMTTYRQYLVNHEVGHRLGHGHVGCPGSGLPAPVMMQQTKYTAPCYPNGWPLPYER
jgi:hypothetical protein